VIIHGAESGAESRAESRAESMRKKIIFALKETPLSKSEIAAQIGLNNITGALNRTIKKMIENGEIEYTIPEKPGSRLQKYRLVQQRTADEYQ
jgi:predicted ArsR family transcriptional regulator